MKALARFPGLLVALLSAYGVRGAEAQDPRPRVPASPSLVVLIAVDQMRPDYFERFSSQLDGGLARLYRGGAVMTDASLDHGITETAPGHASMLSGRYPRSTGIVSNLFGVRDDEVKLIGGGGEGSSPWRFRGTGLFDWMRLKDPRSRALSVSRKPRGAILPIGRARESVFWYVSDGRFSTSSYYADTLPTWVRRFNARRIPATYAGRPWTLLLARDQYSEPDSASYEHAGQDYTFPHWFSADPDAAASELPSFPAMDSITLHFALAGVSALRIGRGPQADLLSVSLSTTDAVGHRYGPDSRELHDQILRLDRYLGVFIDSLYKLRDSSRVVFAFTSDHGVTSFPEFRTGRPVERPNLVPVVAAAAAKLPRSGDSSSLNIYRGVVTLDRRALVSAGINVDSVITSLAADLRRVPGVLRVDAVSDLADADTVHDAIARRWAHALPSDFPAVLTVTLEQRMYRGNRAEYESDNLVEAQHGSPHDDDAAVPIIFYGARIAPGSYARRARVVDIAPTLAELLRLAPTERLDGRVIREIIRQ